MGPDRDELRRQVSLIRWIVREVRAENPRWILRPRTARSIKHGVGYPIDSLRLVDSGRAVLDRIRHELPAEDGEDGNPPGWSFLPWPSATASGIVHARVGPETPRQARPER